MKKHAGGIFKTKIRVKPLVHITYLVHMQAAKVVLSLD